jgi:hypothetical protein
MSRAHVLALLTTLFVLACSDDPQSPAVYSGAGAPAAAACLDVSGTWTIASHCGSALVGMPIMVTQSACMFTTSGAFPGFTGTLQPDGSFTLAGNASGTSVSCTGTATDHTLTQTCTGNCNVTLTR